MTKNTKTIVLLGVVVLIWGYFIYSLVSGFSDSDDTSAALQQNASFQTPEIQERERFELASVEKDPFLGTLYRKSKTTKRTIVSKKPKEVIKWPSIQYSGVVSDNASETSIFILSINGKQHLVKRGEIIGDLQVVKGTREKITLKFQSETKEFDLM